MSRLKLIRLTFLVCIFFLINPAVLTDEVAALIATCGIEKADWHALRPRGTKEKLYAPSSMFMSPVATGRSR